jgi:outer membrane cobalamin receptor
MRPSRVSLFYLLSALGGVLSLAAQPQPPTPPVSPTPPASPKAPAASSDDVVQLEKFEVNEMKTFSDQAISGKTPVAFTEMGKETLATELGSRDIPLVLNTAPSVYATQDSGGAGDSRVNVRGFSQRNVAILINGVPTNDLENGWLYWSNWDGLGDVTSTIQVQRGLSNTTLPTPSIGGTMNVVTDPAASRRGASVKTEAGSNDFYKLTGVYNSGLLKGKFAVTAGLALKQGEGFADASWSKSAGYYLGASWKVNATNRFELFAVGSVQQHGRRSFASNLAAYDLGYARELGYTDAQIYSTGSGADAGALRQGAVGAGQRFNPNAAPLTTAYNGRQYYWGGTHGREKDGVMNEVVNYSHKPQINLNWYTTLAEDLKLTSVFYYSGVQAGSSGTLGTVQRYNSATPSLNGNVNWDATIAQNQNNLVGGVPVARGILRNSTNYQEQFGVVSKLSYQITPELKITTGLDWRTAEIKHYREVRDLLGGDYYLPTSAVQVSDFWADGMNTRLGLGDKVDYYNTNTVDWLGLFVQGEYESGPVTAFAVYGYSTIKYGFTDHFRRASDGGEYELDSDSLDGNQVKGGVQYAFNDEFSAFVNAGFVDKIPNFDGVINDQTGTLVDGGNETFVSYEAGVRYQTPGRTFNVSANVYHTTWEDRTTSSVNTTADTITYLRGMNSQYKGVEIESAWEPLRWVRFDAAASFAEWTYTNDVQGEAFNLSTGSGVATTSRVYIRDLKVGDAPQSQVAYAVTFKPAKGLSVKAQGRWYDRYWADFTPESRTVADYGQPWKIPSYSIYDLHVNYTLPISSRKFDVNLFLHVFNVLDKTYVSDATDESSFEGVGLNLASRHSVQRAEVFLGEPISWNAGVRVSF